jgi:hypothetical protein
MGDTELLIFMLFTGAIGSAAVLGFSLGSFAERFFFNPKETIMSAKLKTLAGLLATLTTDVQTLTQLTTAHAQANAANADLPAQIAEDDAETDQLIEQATVLQQQVTDAIAANQPPVPAV